MEAGGHWLHPSGCCLLLGPDTDAPSVAPPKRLNPPPPASEGQSVALHGDGAAPGSRGMELEGSQRHNQTDIWATQSQTPAESVRWPSQMHCVIIRHTGQREPCHGGPAPAGSSPYGFPYRWARQEPFRWLISTLRSTHTQRNAIASEAISSLIGP